MAAVTKEQENSSLTEHLSEDEDDGSSIYSYIYYDEEEDLVDFLPAEETFEKRDDHIVKESPNFNKKIWKGSDHLSLAEFDTVPPASVASIPQLLQPEPLHNREKDNLLYSRSYCHDCGSENHAPVSDCTRVSQFLKQRQELPTFSPAVIQCCMEYVIHLVRTQFAFNDDKVARARCLSYAWNVRRMLLDLDCNVTFQVQNEFPQDIELDGDLIPATLTVKECNDRYNTERIAATRIQRPIRRDVLSSRIQKNTKTTPNEDTSNGPKRHWQQPIEPAGRLPENF
jgi:hypothetical protein